jgi:hypothetical protein
MLVITCDTQRATCDMVGTSNGISMGKTMRCRNGRFVRGLQNGLVVLLSLTRPVCDFYKSFIRKSVCFVNFVELHNIFLGKVKNSLLFHEIFEFFSILCTVRTFKLIDSILMILKNLSGTELAVNKL